MSTNTNTNSFTITNAKYLGSKIASDLYQLQQFYGSPSLNEIEDYISEAVILLKDGYLHSVDYGFKRNGIWVFALSYEISSFNDIDQTPGRVPIGVDIVGASWGSYLRTTLKFNNLPITEQQKVLESIAIKRVGATDPQNGSNCIYDKSYSSGGININRKIIK